MMPERLMNENRISIFERNMTAYLENKPRDCLFYSEDGAKLKAHKVLNRAKMSHTTSGYPVIFQNWTFCGPGHQSRSL
jgi:hypothetical protein